LKRLLDDRTGATAAEYALLLGIIGAAVGLAAIALGNSIGSSVNRSSGEIRNCGGSC
jgi:pilus assembly protein Flp/PilA